MVIDQYCPTVSFANDVLRQGKHIVVHDETHHAPDAWLVSL